MNTCENCGSRVYRGACVNCHEEVYIMDQYEVDGVTKPPLSQEFVDKVQSQKEEIKHLNNL